MDKEPFVSGLYRPEEDARNQPDKPIAQIIDDAVRNKHASAFGPLRPPTEEEARLTRRKLGEKEEE